MKHLLFLATCISSLAIAQRGHHDESNEEPAERPEFRGVEPSSLEKTLNFKRGVLPEVRRVRPQIQEISGDGDDELGVVRGSVAGKDAAILTQGNWRVYVVKTDRPAKTISDARKICGALPPPRKWRVPATWGEMESALGFKEVPTSIEGFYGLYGAVWTDIPPQVRKKYFEGYMDQAADWKDADKHILLRMGSQGNVGFVNLAALAKTAKDTPTEFAALKRKFAYESSVGVPVFCTAVEGK